MAIDPETKTLIEQGQAFRGESDQYAELITELADALEREAKRADRLKRQRKKLNGLLDRIHDVLYSSATNGVRLMMARGILNERNPRS